MSSKRLASRSRHPARPGVYILGSHELHGFSMNRYTELLARGYRQSGELVTILRPTSRFSRRMSDDRLRKLVAYIEQLILFPLRARWTARRARVVHIADHSDALWLLMWGPAGNVVVTCHDLIAVRASIGEIPEHSTRWSGRIYQSLVRRGLRRAKVIAAVSGSTAQDVKRLVRGVDVRVVYSPVDGALMENHPTRTLGDDDFALVVSSSGWRKRREHAIAVWLRLREVWTAAPLRLIIVGPPLNDLEQRSVPYEAESAVSRVSGLSDSELAELYSRAVVLIQVSRYEGFGWPIVEANAQGTLALCSDIEVFREVGGANLFVPDELDRVAWVEVRDELQGDVFEVARQNASRFSSEAFAVALKGLVEDIAEGRT